MTLRWILCAFCAAIIASRSNCRPRPTLQYGLTIGDFFDISNFRHAQVLDRQGGDKQSIPAARSMDIIKPGYPGLEAVKPVNPGLKIPPPGFAFPIAECRPTVKTSAECLLIGP